MQWVEEYLTATAIIVQHTSHSVFTSPATSYIQVTSSKTILRSIDYIIHFSEHYQLATPTTAVFNLIFLNSYGPLKCYQLSSCHISSRLSEILSKGISPIRKTMCFYHAYSHICGHTEMILQRLCTKGQMKQQKCARGQEGVILASVKVETRCAICPGR
ncbi:hypothetical protein IQ06DRAFT_21574 [Phaeosphaeriaceae sp. SRC1lsM3a]|nr:hypothetical protein IQ06DRAFT_21574 [Stagonospora sp. SRC1lsM3a]